MYLNTSSTLVQMPEIDIDLLCLSLQKLRQLVFILTCVVLDFQYFSDSKNLVVIRKKKPSKFRVVSKRFNCHFFHWNYLYKSAFSIFQLFNASLFHNFGVILFVDYLADVFDNASVMERVVMNHWSHILLDYAWMFNCNNLCFKLLSNFHWLIGVVGNYFSPFNFLWN